MKKDNAQLLSEVPLLHSCLVETNVDLDAVDANRRHLPDAIDSHPNKQLYRGKYDEAVEIIRTFNSSDYELLVKHSHRMWWCGRVPSIQQKTNGENYLSIGRCRCRACPLCAVHRQRQTEKRINTITEKWDNMRHVVLTLRAENCDLDDQLNNLISSYRRLRQSVLWKRTVVAAIATVEVTLNNQTGMWHPHLHILTTGHYLPQKELSSQWFIASNGSTIVWIGAVHSRKMAAKYISKYIAKPAETSEWSDVDTEEMWLALHGRRCIIATGKAHGHKVGGDDKNEEPKGSKIVMYLHTMREAYYNDKSLNERIWPYLKMYVKSAAELIDRKRFYAEYRADFDYHLSPVLTSQLMTDIEAWYTSRGRIPPPMKKSRKPEKLPTLFDGTASEGYLLD